MSLAGDQPQVEVVRVQKNNHPHGVEIHLTDTGEDFDPEKDAKAIYQALDKHLPGGTFQILAELMDAKGIKDL